MKYSTTDSLAALAACVSPGALLDAADAMAPYLSDWTGKETGDAIAVARPASTAEVSSLLRVACEHDLAVTPQGGNTGLTGASVPRSRQRCLLLSLDRMTAVRSMDAFTPSITAEAGCVLADLQAAAREAGFAIPLGLGAEGSCTLGGVISTNAGGIRALRYGNCRENVMGLEVVLPDGSIWNGLRALRKHNMGYDLKQLFIGAEGGLGVVTAAVMRLTPAWRQIETALVATPDPASAMTLLNEVRGACGDAVVACELIEGIGMELALSAILDAQDPLPGDFPWYVLIEAATAADQGSLRAAFETGIGQALSKGAALDAVLAENEGQRSQLWRLREGVVDGQRRAGASIKHDVSVPLGAVPEFIDRASTVARTIVPGCRPLSFGHIGDGNIHFTVIQPSGDEPPSFLKHAPEVMARVHDIALALGGSISAEHGVGTYKRDEFHRVVDAVELDLFGRIKSAIDPSWRMNPGVLLSPGG
ncbi:MAG: FAD-binding oxidoreductase [Brevundimonas sp.]|uniref:FAD-binding oxidoreductase n=1 Tax=Brevundimonas sp. TaxID=1871086 RepID=UPI002487CA53|nr:FAD-binding oxidoreductase [Brevundimonas sp.]MDI1326207.1 FAD-binding oxidoreductase [Brevundimonas sp.]